MCEKSHLRTCMDIKRLYCVCPVPEYQIISTRGGSSPAPCSRSVIQMHKKPRRASYVQVIWPGFCYCLLLLMESGELVFDRRFRGQGRQPSHLGLPFSIDLLLLIAAVSVSGDPFLHLNHFRSLDGPGSNLTRTCTLVVVVFTAAV